MNETKKDDVVRYEDRRQDTAAKQWLLQQALEMTVKATRPVKEKVTGKTKTVAIATAIANSKGICSESKDDVSHILEVVLDIPKLDWRKYRKDIDDTYFKMKRYTVLMPLKNENGHDYELNKPVMIRSDGDDLAVCMNGRTGAHLDLYADDSVLRIATPKEVRLFVDKCDIKRIFSVLNIQPMFM